MLFDGPPPAAYNQIDTIRNLRDRQEIADEQDSEELINEPYESDCTRDSCSGNTTFSDQQQEQEDEENEHGPNWQYQQYPAQWPYVLEESLEWHLGITAEPSPSGDTEAPVKQPPTLRGQLFNFIRYLFDSKTISAVQEKHLNG